MSCSESSRCTYEQLISRAMGALFCLLSLGIALGLRELRFVLCAYDDDDEMMSGEEGSS